MAARSGYGEKSKYWEQRLTALLQPIPIQDLLVLAWSIEALQNNRSKCALRYSDFPGEVSEYDFGGSRFLPPWEVEYLLNYRLTLGHEFLQDSRRLDLSAWSAVAKLFNTYRGLSNVQSVKDFAGNEILSAMPRTFWPQYDWQIGFENSRRLGRAWFLYATPEGKSAFYKKHSVQLEAFLRSAFAFYVLTTEHPTFNITGLGLEKIGGASLSSVVRLIGGDLKLQTTNAKENYSGDLPLECQRSAVRERPLFVAKHRGALTVFVPLRALLLLRITDGLYYDVVSDGDAQRAAGQRFEELCAKLLDHYFGKECAIEPEKPTSYGKSADLFCFDRCSDLGFIVECKGRRLPQRILTSANPWKDFEIDFDDVVKGIVQIWRTHSELFSNTDKEMVGVVLLNSPWTILGNAFLDKLYEKAHRMADSFSISGESRIKVALNDFADFEKCLAQYNIKEIHVGVSQMADRTHHGYLLSSVVRENGCQAEQRKGFDYYSIASESVSWWGNFR